MRSPAHPGPGHLRGVRADVAEEFAELLPPWGGRTEIRVAEAVPDGQVPDGAVEELLHRLVACRLQQRLRGPV